MSIEEVKERIAKLRDAIVLAAADLYISSFSKAWSDEARAAALEARRAKAHSHLESHGWKLNPKPGSSDPRYHEYNYIHPDKPGESIDIAVRPSKFVHNTPNEPDVYHPGGTRSSRKWKGGKLSDLKSHLSKPVWDTLH